MSSEYNQIQNMIRFQQLMLVPIIAILVGCILGSFGDNKYLIMTDEKCRGNKQESCNDRCRWDNNTCKSLGSYCNLNNSGLAVFWSGIIVSGFLLLIMFIYSYIMFGASREDSDDLTSYNYPGYLFGSRKKKKTIKRKK
jgi:hypothetical protein